MDRSKLPRDVDNYNVYCQRCKKVHRYYTFTQVDFDRVMDEAVVNIRKANYKRSL